MLASPSLVMFPLTGGRVHWFVDRAGHTPPAGAATRPDQLANWLGGWPQIVLDTIAATPPEQFRYDEIRDHLPDRPWGQDRVTLLGDAAHAMLPVLGRGACEAIDDSATLAAALAEGTDSISSPRGYEQRRGAETARLVRLARRAALLRHVTPWLAPLLQRLPPTMLERQATRYLNGAIHGG